MSKMTEQAMIAAMYNLQDTFNKTVHPQWELQNFDWKRAIVIENAEAMGSWAWKWWKKGTDDYNNYKVEMVDIWHFVMSMDMKESLDMDMQANYVGLTKPIRSWDAYIEEMIDKIDEYTPAIIADSQFILERLDELMEATYIAAADAETLDLVDTTLRIWKETVGTIEELYKLYVGKNVLNGIRQENGYKTGEYKKLWNGVEDNVVMMQILDELPPSEDLFQVVYHRLDKKYKSL